MKTKKILSVILSVIMSFSMLGVVSTSAEEFNKKIYTLDELLEMDNDEFLNLYVYVYSGEGLVTSIERTVEKNRVNGFFGLSLTDVKDEDKTGVEYEAKIDVKYEANTFEQKITALLGDSIQYIMISPITESEKGGYYCLDFNLRFRSNLESFEATD